MVDLGDRAFLRAQTAREIAEMVDRQRQVGGGRLADRLAVVDRLDQREEVQLLLHPIGDLQQDAAALGGRGAAPGVLGLVRGVQRQLDILGGAARDLADGLARDRRGIVEILPAHGGNPLAADEIVVFRADHDIALQLLDSLVQHEASP